MVFGVTGEITRWKTCLNFNFQQIFTQIVKTSQEEWRDRMFLWDRLYWQTKREILADIVAQVLSTVDIGDKNNNNNNNNYSVK